MPRMDMPEGANVAAPGEYSLIQAALSNRGNPTSGGFGNLMVVEKNQPVRIVDNKTGKVVFEGIGPEAARRAVELGQNISDTKGNKAAWSIQTVPVGTNTYATIANEKANRSDLARIADVALPTIGAILAGPIGAAAGSAASSAAQGRDIKDLLLRAAISGGTAAIMPGGAPAPGSDTAVSAAADAALQNAVSAGAQAGSQALSSAYGSTLASALGSTAGSAAGSAVAPAIGDIVVTAARNAAPSSLFPAVTSGISNTLLDQVINQPAQVEQPTPTSSAFPEELIVTAKDAAPVTFGNVAPALLPSVGAALGSSIASTATPDLTQTPEKKGLLDRLTSNMGITDYLTVASLLGSGVSRLLGGGGGAGTTAGPYVSPFGSGLGGAGFGTGQDMRVNPNIADYERYGFGPEASFFAPGYSQLVSGAAGAPAATTAGPASAMVNPQYVPLI